MARRGKRITEARGLVDREHEFSPAEAIATIKRLANAKFDESIEVHIRTGLNVRVVGVVLILAGVLGLLPRLARW